MQILKVLNRTSSKQTSFRNLAEIEAIASGIIIPKISAKKVDTIIKRLEQLELDIVMINTLLSSLEHQFVKQRHHSACVEMCSNIKKGLHDSRFQLLTTATALSREHATVNTRKFLRECKGDNKFLLHTREGSYAYAYYKSLTDDSGYKFKDYWICMSTCGKPMLTFLNSFRAPGNFIPSISMDGKFTDVLREEGFSKAFS